MAASPVTPVAGDASVVTTGGAAAVAVVAGPNGGFIVNPFTAVDQGLGAVEQLFVDPVTNALTSAHGTTFALQPGQTWPLIAGQTTPTTVNAVSSGHRFSVVKW
jgi:hypothetical protein